MAKTIIPKRRKLDMTSKSYKPKYNTLISIPSEVSEKHIDKICEEIEKGQTIKTACTRAGVDYHTLSQQILCKQDTTLSVYAISAIGQAQDNFEAKLTEAILDPKQFNNKHLDILKEFLQIVSPRFSRQMKIAYKYDLRIFLDVLKQYVSEDVLLQIVNHLRSQDPHGILAEYDDKLLLE